MRGMKAHNIKMYDVRCMMEDGKFPQDFPSFPIKTTITRIERIYKEL